MRGKQRLPIDLQKARAPGDDLGGGRVSGLEQTEEIEVPDCGVHKLDFA